MAILRLLAAPFEARYFAVSMVAGGAVFFGWLAYMLPSARLLLMMPTLVCALLFVQGIYDLVQRRHSILRNYPLLAHLRFFFEAIRPEMRQYFFEDDKEGRPFPRDKRAIVYQRAKNALDKRPFGTVYDTYEPRYEWLNHSMTPIENHGANFRVMIGAKTCAQPYESSVLNISGMSFGAISPNAIRAMNSGARKGSFAQVTGEGAISRYHLENEGDIIWQIASGYFGCRTPDGMFDPAAFADKAKLPTVKMIEVKLSQGAKPGHGGVLPQAKITEEIAQTRGIPRDRECISPAQHSAFSTPLELMSYVTQLRELSGGKPVGIKLCIGHRWQALALVKAMLESGQHPDYIAIDGGEGGTGASPLEFADHIGMPMRDAVSFMHNALVGANLRDEVVLIASGKIATAFDMVRAFTLGADVCHSARVFMFAVGCIQAQACHTGHCPTGVATTDPLRQRAIVVKDKATRVANYHRQTLEALGETIGAAGLSHPSQLNPHHLWRRVSVAETKTFQDLYPPLAPGELLTGTNDAKFARPWQRAQAASFDPLEI